MSANQFPVDTYHCKACGRTIQGASELCVICYHRAMKPCPQCMRRTPSGRRVPMTVLQKWRAQNAHVHHSKQTEPPGKREGALPADCDYCQNERYIIVLDRE